MIDDALWAAAAFIPEPGAAALLADPGFVLAAELDLGLRVLPCDFVRRGGGALVCSAPAPPCRPSDGAAGSSARTARALDQPPHAALAVGHAVAVLGNATEIDDAPGGEAVAFRVRAAQHDRLERRLLALAQPGPTAGARLVAQARDARGVEPDHPVAQRLAIHPRGPRRRRPAHPIQHLRPARAAAPRRGRRVPAGTGGAAPPPP